MSDSQWINKGNCKPLQVQLCLQCKLPYQMIIHIHASFGDKMLYWFNGVEISRLSGQIIHSSFWHQWHLKETEVKAQFLFATAQQLHSQGIEDLRAG